MVTKYHKGFPRREFIKTRTRNEALDCRVYALAAYSILNIRNINKLVDRIELRSEQQNDENTPVQEPVREPKRVHQPRKRQGGYANWR